jgi:hypothetical protein
VTKYATVTKIRIKKMPAIREPHKTWARFWGYVDKTATCWLWNGPRWSTGYGMFIYHQEHLSAHRFVYTLCRGPIPKGLVIDHLCRNPRCVNPSHLEAVKHSENILRGFGRAARLARMTVCGVAGHPLSGKNLYVSPDGKRRCRACKKAYLDKYYQEVRRPKECKKWRLRKCLD